MRKLLTCSTALSVALSSFHTMPARAQTLAEDGSVLAPDGVTVLCTPTPEAPCDLEAITAALQEAAAADEAARAAAEAEAAAAQAAADAAAAEEAARVAAEAAAAQAAADAAAAEEAAQAAADAAAAEAAARRRRRMRQMRRR